MKCAFVIASLLVSAHIAYADQGSFSNSGGSTQVGSSLIINSNVTTPAGTLTINCPVTTAGACAGGTFSILSSDGTTSVSASFSSATFKETCWGGGRGRPVTCAYSFTGNFSGTLTLNGAGQAIIGLTSQGFGTTGGPAGGTSIYNSAYTPFYFSNSGQIVRSDDLQGTNLITYGTQGNGVGQFYGAYGPGLDSATSLSMGLNSTAPSIAVDPSGMVLVGGGGAQIIDNMAAVRTSSSALTNYYGDYGYYYVFGATLVPQPSPRPSALSVSPAALTFAAIQDTGTSSPSQPVTISNFGGSPLNFSGISASSQFAETDNCPGSLPAGASCTANVSFAPTVAGPASGQLTVNDDSGNLGTSQTVNLSGTASLPRHLTLSPATLSFVGTIGVNPNKTVTVSNTGGSDVALAGIAMSGDASFVQRNTCGSTVSAGATCTVTVTFSSSAYGIFGSTLIVSESSGAQETVSVSGTSSPDSE